MISIFGLNTLLGFFGHTFCGLNARRLMTYFRWKDLEPYELSVSVYFKILGRHPEKKKKNFFEMILAWLSKPVLVNVKL